MQETTRWARREGGGGDPLRRLSELDLRQQLTAEDMTLLVKELRSMGVPWRRIGEQLGISAQAAHRRYASLIRSQN